MSSSTVSQHAAPVHSEFADDPDYREILDLFGEALPERCRSLVDAFRQGKTTELASLAHQLKGAGGGFGFHELTGLASDLEQACARRDPAAIAQRLDCVLEYMHRIVV